MYKKLLLSLVVVLAAAPVYGFMMVDVITVKGSDTKVGYFSLS
jgi:hypothetical protein